MAGLRNGIPTIGNGSTWTKSPETKLRHGTIQTAKMPKSHHRRTGVHQNLNPARQAIGIWDIPRNNRGMDRSMDRGMDKGFLPRDTVCNPCTGNSRCMDSRCMDNPCTDNPCINSNLNRNRNRNRAGVGSVEDGWGVWGCRLRSVLAVD